MGQIIRSRTRVRIRRDGNSTGIMTKTGSNTSTVSYVEGQGFVTTYTYKESMTIEKPAYDK